jgi:hypothetical protein
LNKIQIIGNDKKTTLEYLSQNSAIDSRKNLRKKGGKSPNQAVYKPVQSLSQTYSVFAGFSEFLFKPALSKGMEK